MTTPTVQDMIADVDKFVLNLGRLDQIVNGSVTTTVAIDSGNVPSLAKFLSEFTDSANAYILAQTITVKDQAVTASNSASTSAAAALVSQNLAAGYASDSLSVTGNVIYDSAVSISALTIPDGITAIRTNGYSVVGDTGACVYRLKASGEADEMGQLTSNGGTKKWGIIVPVLTPEIFGAKSDWNGTSGTDNTAAINAFHAAMKFFKRPGYLTGFYYCATNLNTVTDTVFVLSGTDRNSCGYVFDAACTLGLVINQTDYTYPTNITNTGFFTLGQETITNLSVSYTSSDSINNRTLPRAYFGFLALRGWNVFTQGPSIGFYTKNINRQTMYEIAVTGRRNTSATTQRLSFGNMSRGIVWDADTGLSSIPGDSTVSECQVYNSQIAFFENGENEGMTFRNSKAIGCWEGIVGINTTTRPGMTILGCHMNIFDSGVRLVNQPQAVITDNLIYKFLGADGTTIAINLDTCDLAQVSRNTLENSCTDMAVSGSYHGVKLNSSVHCIIDGIIHNRGSYTVWLTGGTTFAQIGKISAPNLYANETLIAEIQDDSTGNNQVGGRVGTIANTSAVTVSNTLTNILTFNFTNTVKKGQKYRVTARLTLTKGATAGTTSVSLGLTAGTATVVWDSSATILKGRIDPQGASTDGVLIFTGDMNVTGTGTAGSAAITLQALSIGSNGTVAIGDAQIVVDKL